MARTVRFSFALATGKPTTSPPLFQRHPAWVGGLGWSIAGAAFSRIRLAVPKGKHIRLSSVEMVEPGSLWARALERAFLLALRAAFAMPPFQHFGQVGSTFLGQTTVTILLKNGPGQEFSVLCSRPC